jgi:hypothetical protein
MTQLRFSVTFTYTKSGNTKFLRSDYGDEYSKDERNELLLYIIDSILPCCNFESMETAALSNAWDDFKYNEMDLQ